MTFPNLDVVGFDLDGTLADTAADLAASLNHVLVQMDRPALSTEAVRRMVGHGVQALIRKGLAATGGAPEALVERGIPMFFEYYAQNICEQTRPYEGVSEVLDTLSAGGLRLAICTNKPERLAVQLVEALGWTWRFASVVGGDTLATRKPDPAPLHEAIARAGGRRAVFVGDSITDADTARAAGVPLIAVSFGFSDRPVGQLGADAIIDHYHELIPALRQLAPGRPA